LAAKEGPGAILEVRVQPRSSKDEVRREGQGVKVRVRAAPVEGAANEAVIAALSKALGLPKSSLTIERGATGRKKLVRVKGIGAEELPGLLSNLPEK